MSDVRQDPEVRSTLQEMGLSIDQIWKMGDGDLAFFMRDQCDQDAWLQSLFETCPHIENEPLYGTTATQWIRAAVKAWKGAKECQ